MYKMYSWLIIIMLSITSCNSEEYDVNQPNYSYDNSGIINNSTFNNLINNNDTEENEIDDSQSLTSINPIFDSMGYNEIIEDSIEISNEILMEDINEPYDNFDNVIDNYTFLYNMAINEKCNDIKAIKLARAEEYLLDSCVIFPYMDDYINYGITRVVPASYVNYNGSTYSMDYLIVTEELLNKEIIEQSYNVNNIKDFLIENGYSLKDKVTFFHFEEVSSINLFDKMNFDNRLIISQCHSSLFKIDNKGNLINDLCDDYVVSDDGLTYTFKLKDNIFWYNYKGEIVDTIKAIDFVTGLKCYLTNMVGNSKIAGAEEFLNNLHTFDKVKINAINEKELSLSLVEPNINLFYDISTYLFPLHYDNLLLYNSPDNSYSYKDVYYSGSYLISDFNEREIRLKKNTNYHNAENVNMDEIVYCYEIIPSNSIIDKTLNKEYDQISCSYNDKMYKLISNNILTKNSFYAIKDRHRLNFGCFNMSKEILNDNNLRKALVYSFNKEKFIKGYSNEEYIDKTIANYLTPLDFANKYSVSKNYNSNLKGKKYYEIIQYFANKREKIINYKNTYNETLAAYYFDKFISDYNVNDKIVLNIVTTSFNKNRVIGYLEDVKRLSNELVDFNIDTVNNQFDYYVMTNKMEYDIILFNYWIPDYCDASAFLAPFTKGGEKINLLGLSNK